jgi:outer membrane protein assembly factor BamB
MQISVDPESNLLAVVLAKDAKNKARDGFKAPSTASCLDLATGAELWKYEIGEVEMMPARWSDDSDKDVDYTLDNYYPPVFVDGRLYVFYEGCDFIRRALRQRTTAREVSRQRRRTSR